MYFFFGSKLSQLQEQSFFFCLTILKIQFDTVFSSNSNRRSKKVKK